jgi:hypothetical protein
MNDKDQQKSSPDNKEGEENDKEPTGQPKEGVNPPDVEEAAEEGIQESRFGERSYAAPDFDKDDDDK